MRSDLPAVFSHIKTVVEMDTLGEWLEKKQINTEEENKFPIVLKGY